MPPTETAETIDFASLESIIEQPVESRPIKGYHSARLRDPKDFKKDKYGQKLDTTIYGKIKVPADVYVVWGQLKTQTGDQAAPQALRFPSSKYSVAKAKKWLKDHNVKYILFEPAKEDDSLAQPALERRFTSADACRVHIQKRDDGSQVIAGYASVFYDPADEGTEYQLWGGTVERILPGAFDRVIEEHQDARALFNHDSDHLLGRVSAKTLRLSVDKRGLQYEIDPPETQLGKDLPVSIERGDLSGSSFSFIVGKTVWIVENEGTDQERTIREIHEISELFDVGPVTYPAYEATTAGVRGEGDLGEARADYDAWHEAREASMSKLAAELAERNRRLRLIEIDRDIVNGNMAHR